MNSMLILNADNQPILPKKFRTSLDSFIQPSQVSREGLEELNFSASGQFSEQSLDYLLSQTTLMPFYLIDLREESHGFVNGMAVSWYGIRNASNSGKTTEEIKKIEQTLLSNLKNKKITIYKILEKDPNGEELPKGEPHFVFVESTRTEEELAALYQIQYMRIPCTDHTRPTDAIVELFVSFMKELPDEYWLHFHCSAGKGRTTLFTVMYDMMKNAKKLDFNTIVERHWLIGGTHLLNLAGEDTLWKYPYTVERVHFLQKFYHYCTINSENFQISWKDYLRKEYIPNVI